MLRCVELAEARYPIFAHETLFLRTGTADRGSGCRDARAIITGRIPCMRVRLLSLQCALAIATLSGLAPAAAIAQSPGSANRPVLNAAIAPMPLKQALAKFTARTGLKFVYASQLLEGVQSPGAPAGLAPEETLRRLLRGTGLGYQYLSASTITLIKADDSPPVAPARAGRATKTSAATPEVTDLQTLVVTGTNIRDIVPPGTPVIVIDAEDIRRSGYSGTEQVLQALPQNFRGGQAGAVADVNMSIGGQRGFNATAGSGVNLRGLGTTATLVLINGRRIAATSAGTFTDISLIPIDAIERIEILTDGASAIYGADAVAGVVNIILKRDYDSAETRATYGSTTSGGREEFRLSQSFGRRWETGSLMLSAEYLRQGELMADEREATQDVADPTSIFPSNTLKSVVLSASQSLSEKLRLSLDMQYSDADRHGISTDGGARNDNFGKPTRRNAVLSLEYLAPRDWQFTVDGFISDEDSENRSVDHTPEGELENVYNQHRTQDQRGGEVRANGPLFDLPGGTVKLAVGASYKEEKYRRTIDLFDLEQNVSRRNNSLFAELYVPIVGKANAVPGIHQLDMSIAVRRDAYSDFGSSTNPRFGLSWSPTPSLTLRSSYSTSFRAPSVGEEKRFGDLGIFALDVSPYFSADGSGFVPVVTLLGSDDLKPEESRNWTFGLDWKPAFAPGLDIGVTYYDIVYSDRITLPPFDIGALGNPELQQFVRYYDSPEEVRALVEAFIGQGAFFDDFTDGMFGPDPLGQTFATYSYVWTNADRVDVSGYDVNVDYGFVRGESRFELGINANYILQMLNRVSPTSEPFDLVGTFANPPKLRMRGTMAWLRKAWSANLNVNYMHSYTDTSGAVDRPVDSFTTVDGVLSYAFAPSANAAIGGLSLSLIVTNLFDEQPPYVGFSGRGSHYDAANASPLGRTVSMQIGKQW
jgi:outer membrane receptor protein involved in Fe transport